MVHLFATIHIHLQHVNHDGVGQSLFFTIMRFHPTFSLDIDLGSILEVISNEERLAQFEYMRKYSQNPPKTVSDTKEVQRLAHQTPSFYLGDRILIQDTTPKASTSKCLGNLYYTKETLYAKSMKTRAL